jgi:septal ring factor EnvC (AmiA/AmiB activator)
VEEKSQEEEYKKTIEQLKKEVLEKDKLQLESNKKIDLLELENKKLTDDLKISKDESKVLSDRIEDLKKEIQLTKSRLLYHSSVNLLI